MILIALLAALAVFAGPVAGYLESTATQVFDRAGYVAAVLSPEGEV
jgi:multicomponent K+:H+ antiporter subunit D